MLQLAFALFSIAVPIIVNAQDQECVDFKKLNIVGQNVTNEYEKLFAKDSKDLLSSENIEKVRNLNILFIPGFLANQLLKIGPYFDDQMAWLTKQHIENSRVPINSEEDPVINGQTIVIALRESKKPVLLIGHSKGGIDILQALVSNEDLWPKVKGLVLIQSPLYGSPIADSVCGSNFKRTLVFAVLKSMGGDETSLKSLQSGERQKWMNEHKEILEKLWTSIPILSIATWKDAKGLKDSWLSLLRNEMVKNNGVKNDGLVPWMSAVYPGTDYVAIGGLDHAVTIKSTIWLDMDRVRLLETILTMMLDRMKK